MAKGPVSLCALLLLLPAARDAADVEAEKRKLLALHEEFKAAHLRGDAETILQRLAEVSLFEKRGGEWVMTGDVSTFRQ
jgi:hypothetical protein